MQKRIIALCGVLLISTQLLSQSTPDTLWTRTFGGINNDYGWSVQQTEDDGYIIAGMTESFGAGDYDVYLIKTNSAGYALWSRTYGGNGEEKGVCVKQTNDGGYIIAGQTESYGAGDKDLYLMKTDSSGDTLWTKTYGGSYIDIAGAIQQNADGGYIITGGTSGAYDVWLIKIETNGDTLWTKTYGGTSTDWGNSVLKTQDGGYIIAGGTYSYGAGDCDVYLIRTNSFGDTLWTRVYGGENKDWASSIQKTNDGSYIITGGTYSYGAGDCDVWIIKIETNGDTLWTKTYGGIGYDQGHEVQQTPDGGYIIVSGGHFTYKGDLETEDVVLIKTDSNGNTLWTRTYGGADDDGGLSLQMTTDGGYIIGGYTKSYGAGGYDFWLLRIASISNGYIRGNVFDEGSYSPIQGAIVYTTGNYFSNPTNELGEYNISLPFGYGYHLFAYATGYELNEITGIDVTEENPIVTVDIALTPISASYEIVNLDPNPNPTISTIMQGGTVHRYYFIRDEDNFNPGLGIEVEVVSSDNSYSFSSDQDGIVDISIPSSHIGYGQSGDTEDYSIISVNGNPISPTIDFTCEVTNPVYSKYWDSKEFGKLGVSFFSIDFERGSSVQLVENDPYETDAELINITRQARAGAGVDFSVSVGAGVECGDIYAGAGASAGVGGNISGITEDYYEFPHQDYNDWEALAQYILVADGNFGDLDNTLIRFLSLLEEHFTNQTTLEDAYLGDKKGIDVCVNASASASIGAGVTDVMGIGAGANIGSEGHALFNIIHHNDVDMNEYNFGVSGTYTASANAGLVIDVPLSEDWSLGLGGMLNIADYDGTRGMQLSVFKDANTGSFTEFHLKFLHRKEYQGWEEVVTYKISGTDVYNAIESVNNQVEILCNPSSSSGNITVPNNLFSQLLNSIFQILYDLQTNQQGDATISFEKEIKDITDINSFNIEIGMSLTSAISAEIGGGVGFEEGKTKIKENGKWVWGNHLILEEYGNYIPNIPEDYQAVLQEIVDSVPLWIRVLLGLINVFIPGKDDATFYVGDTGSYMFFPDGSIPSSVDSITCVSWSWYGNSPSKTISDVPHDKKGIYKKNRARAENIYGMRYGVGGFYQFEPLNTTLLETCEFTIVYPDSDVVEIDESTLGMYKEDKENHTWIFMGGVLDTLNNSVTAPVTELGLYTLAPRLPLGEFGLNAIPDSIIADSISTSIITSDIIYYNNQLQVTDGELFTVNTESGDILSTDIDTSLAGIQIEAENGIIEFELKSSHIASYPKISAFSVYGSAEAHTYVTFYDTIPPSNPTNLEAVEGNECVYLTWSPNQEDDISGYKIYFDSDESGPPYDGIATVYGLPSPLIIGIDTSYTVKGLYSDSTYYFAITAFDISGNESGYSDEVTAIPFNILNSVTNLIIQVVNNEINISWDAVQNANSYKIYRNIVPEFDIGSITPIAITEDTSYIDTDISGSDKYFYVIVASTDEVNN